MQRSTRQKLSPNIEPHKLNRVVADKRAQKIYNLEQWQSFQQMMLGQLDTYAHIETQMGWELYPRGYNLAPSEKFFSRWMDWLWYAQQWNNIQKFTRKKVYRGEVKGAGRDPLPG